MYECISFSQTFLQMWRDVETFLRIEYYRQREKSLYVLLLGRSHILHEAHFVHNEFIAPYHPPAKTQPCLPHSGGTHPRRGFLNPLSDSPDFLSHAVMSMARLTLQLKRKLCSEPVLRSASTSKSRNSLRNDGALDLYHGLIGITVARL